MIHLFIVIVLNDDVDLNDTICVIPMNIHELIVRYIADVRKSIHADVQVQLITFKNSIEGEFDEEVSKDEKNGPFELEICENDINLLLFPNLARIPAAISFVRDPVLLLELHNEFVDP